MGLQQALGFLVVADVNATQSALVFYLTYTLLMCVVIVVAWKRS